MLETIRNLIFTITTLIAFIAAYINVCNGLIVNIIKKKYKSEIIQQSTYEIIIDWASNASIIIYLVATVYTVGNFFVNEEWKKLFGITESSGSAQLEFGIEVILGVLIIMIILYPAVLMVFAGLDIWVLYCKKLEGTTVKLNKRRYFKRIQLGIVLSVIGSLLGVYYIVEQVGSWFNIIDRYNVNAVKNSISAQELSTLFMGCFITILSITAFIVLKNIKYIQEEIYGKSIYKFYTTEEIIITKCYLNYDEHYLIIEDGIRRYIKKGQVKEIRVMSRE